MPNKTKNPPNFVIIMSDQHRRSAMGCMGDPLAKTPNIDRLAHEGVVFDNFYSNAPLCLPARMSFLTSRHPYEIQCWDSSMDDLSSSQPTFAHALGAAGYETVLSGRMHIVGPDQYHGFEKRPIGDIRGTWLWGGWDLEPILGSLFDTASMYRASMEKSGPGETGYMAYDECVRNATIEWIHERAAQKNGIRPFCLVVGFMTPHSPYVCPRKYFNYHFSRMSLPSFPEGHLEKLHPIHQKIRRITKIDNLTEMEITRTRSAYYGLIEWMDTLIGNILDALQENGLMDNTIIVYTSDHGDQIGDHGLWWKSTFYEGSIGVPLVIYWKGHLKEGSHVTANASLIDIAPTITDFAGAPDIPGASGKSLRPLLFDETVDWPDEVFSEYYDPLLLWTDVWKPNEKPSNIIKAIEGESYDPPQRMIRKGPWKLNVYPGYDPQLFNLEEDPGEFYDRSIDPACKEIILSMKEMVMDSWDPELIEKICKRRKKERSLLRKWVNKIKPYDPFAWPKEGDTLPINRVEQCPEAGQQGINAK